MTRPSKRSSGKQSEPKSSSSRDRNAFIVVAGRRFEILDQLSLPGRGRWLVHDPQPYPNGSKCTAIVLDPTPAATQLERSLLRLTEDCNELPRLKVVGNWNAKKVWILSWREGITLELYLERVAQKALNRVSVSEAIRRVKSLAHLLRILHQDLGIVHGDIKPGNLILPSRRGSFFLIDFGSSWQVEKSAWRVPGDGNQPLYAAPELLIPDAPVDFRADQFSAGVVLYEMLTMERPYQGLGGKAGLPEFRSEMEREYVPPSKKVHPSDPVNRKVLVEIDRVVGKLLMLDADGRFSTPTDFCEAMNRLVRLYENSVSNPILNSSIETSVTIQSATLNLRERLRKLGGIARRFLGDD